MQFDLATAALTIAAFIGGQIVQAVIQEIRATRDAERQRQVRDEERQYTVTQEHARVERELLRERLETTREALTAQTQMALQILAGDRGAAVTFMRSHDPLAWLPTLELSIVGDPAALDSVSEAMALAVTHADDPPHPDRLRVALQAQVAIAEAFRGQDERLRRGEVLARIGDEDAWAIARFASVTNDVRAILRPDGLGRRPEAGP